MLLNNLQVFLGGLKVKQNPESSLQNIEGGRLRPREEAGGKALGAGTYLASLLLPEDGRWGVSFGLALKSHIVSSSCHLVLGLGHQLGWNWQGEGR